MNCSTNQGVRSNRPEEWYHGRLSKNDSEEILRATNKIGSFLIRDSESQKNTYVLSFMKSLDDVKHFRILKICGEYFAEDKKYESLVQFVDYHSTEAVIYSGLYLTHPVKPDII
uniref:SH2 domain-containing protein n=1 Tax=Romanomermis culicivorax TaxID=13658 RepID=A0A915HQZ5_ROMCU